MVDAPLFLNRPEGRIAYEVVGEGPLVVCVPGLGELRASYRQLVPSLVAAGFRAAVMDLRGHGDSDVTFSAYDDVAAGTDILALVDQLGGPAVVIGNSLGAGAAAWAGAENPEAIRGLVLIGPFVRGGSVGWLAGLAFRVALVRPWGYAAWKAYHTSLFPGRRPADLREHQKRMIESLHRPGHWRAFIATTQSSHAPVEERLDEIDVPVLVIMGTRDPDFRDPQAEARQVAHLLHAELLLVPEAGHYPQAEYPEVVGPRVIGFLRRAAATSPPR